MTYVTTHETYWTFTIKNKNIVNQTFKSDLTFEIIDSIKWLKWDKNIEMFIINKRTANW
jgi:hypothetical protein